MDTPERSARIVNASLNSTWCWCIINENISPPVAQAPKHLHDCLLGVTINEGVFSSWKGQFALKLFPDFFKLT